MALRIAFVIETSGGGSGRHLLDLAAGLVARGHSVHALYSQVRAEPRFEAALRAIPGIKIKTVAMRRAPHWSDIAAVGAIAKYLRVNGPFDIVHGQSSKGGALVRLATTDRRTARIYTPHCFRTLDPELGRVEHFIYGSAEWLLAYASDAIICVSPEELEHAVAQGLPRNKLHVVYNGVAEPDQSRRDTMRAQLGIGSDDVCVGFLGRYVPQKAPERMIELAVALPKDLPRWRIAMVGEGPLEEALRTQAKAAGVANRFVWGKGDLGPTAMSAFDLFTMPSAYEGMPYVLIEAAAAGLPIIASDVGGARAAISPGENGAIIPNWNSAEFATQVGHLIQDARLRQRMSAASRQKARKFTIDTMVDETLAVYDLGLARRRAQGVRKEQHVGAVVAGKNGL